jgi:hypothetical protein
MIERPKRVCCALGFVLAVGMAMPCVAQTNHVPGDPIRGEPPPDRYYCSEMELGIETLKELIAAAEGRGEKTVFVGWSRYWIPKYAPPRAPGFYLQDDNSFVEVR